jgi:hypothetical protein
MTTQNATNGKVNAAQTAVPFNSGMSITGTGRIETTLLTNPRAEDQLV